MPRPKPAEPTTLITVKVPVSLMADVKAIAEARGVSVSDTIRDGLRRYRKRWLHVIPKNN